MNEERLSRKLVTGRRLASLQVERWRRELSWVAWPPPVLVDGRPGRPLGSNWDELVVDCAVVLTESVELPAPPLGVTAAGEKRQFTPLGRLGLRQLKITG